MSFWVIVGNACAVDGKGVLHAAYGLRKKTKRKTWDAACGKRVRMLGFPVEGKPDDAMTVKWPPYVEDARDWGYERCRDCMKAAPGKPERPPFVKPGSGRSQKTAEAS